MYWRVRKVGPEQMFKQYGVHVGLAFSVLVNLILITTRPATPKVSPEIKMSFEEFAKTVTRHLLDTSYITYSDSTVSLLNGELAPPVIEGLKRDDILPKNEQDLLARAKDLSTKRQVSAVKIEKVMPGELDPRGLLPVEVKGVFIIQSTEESGPPGPVPFDFKYTIGGRMNQDGTPMMMADGHTPMPCISNFQDASPKSQ